MYYIIRKHELYEKNEYTKYIIHITNVFFKYNIFLYIAHNLHCIKLLGIYMIYISYKYEIIKIIKRYLIQNIKNIHTKNSFFLRF